MIHLQSLSLRYDGVRLEVLDQTELPHKEAWLDASHPEDIFIYIQNLQVRGAPMIGVAAALSLSCFAKSGANFQDFQKMATRLREARPTAVNLMHAMDRLLQIREPQYPGKVSQVAEDIFSQDVELCEKIAEQGLSLIVEHDQILTHCNTGALATAGVGTALGLIRKAHEKKGNIHVFVDETRPLLQGGRLTTWELGKLGIPYTLICDNMAGMLMAQGKITKVLVGADRIAANGDFANKIGTYSLAVLAFFHRVPFYVAAPLTTVDLECPSGRQIPIEERAGDEIRQGWAPHSANVYNPAFDVTPAELVTGWILDTALLDLDQVKNKGLEFLVKGSATC